MGERQRLERTLQAMEQANDALRDVLVRHRQATADAVERILSHPPTPDVVDVVQAAPLRTEVTDALARFDRSRHETRLATFAYLRTIPGVSISDIARAFGLSRQLASRLAREADAAVDGPLEAEG